jgi:hypothetical protein
VTLHERLAAAREQLVRAGIQPSEAAVDVDLYARTILKWDRARILLHHQSPVENNSNRPPILSASGNSGGSTST